MNLLSLTPYEHCGLLKQQSLIKSLIRSLSIVLVCYTELICVSKLGMLYPLPIRVIKTVF